MSPSAHAVDPARLGVLLGQLRRRTFALLLLSVNHGASTEPVEASPGQPLMNASQKNGSKNPTIGQSLPSHTHPTTATHFDPSHAQPKTESQSPTPRASKAPQPTMVGEGAGIEPGQLSRKGLHPP